MAKRTTITNGIRWIRFFWGGMAFSALWGAIETAEGRERSFFWFLIFFILTYLFYKMRRVRFDDENIYRMYGKKEKVHAYDTIVSIKRSSAKVNGRRMWKVTYLDENEQKRKFLFLEGTFQHGSTQDFIKRVRKVKPSVLVWQHPFFNHPEEKKG